MEKSQISLSELNKSLKAVISENFFENIWIVAEIGDIKFNRNGHVYLELIEKADDEDKIIAKARATIWSYTMRMLKPYFETTTGQSLQAGLKILIAVNVEFHELYGFSLNIRDIDPTYTLGDIERRRLEIIQQLQSEGVYDMNKEIEMPYLVQKIAIISSPTAAGYEDFMKQLNENNFGYKFYTKLFPSVMQGDAAENSIINSLNNIFEYEDFFDAVVIIRGGGSRSDLMCFDNYELAYFITQFPLPVIVGVGHEKDQSIIDLVSHSSLKTPTAVAEFLISKFYDAEERLSSLLSNIYTYSSDLLSNETTKLETLNLRLIPITQEGINIADKKLQLLSQKIVLTTKSIIENHNQKINNHKSILRSKTSNSINNGQKELENYKDKLEYRVNQLLKKQNNKIEYIEKSIKYLDPKNILKKGYSISKINGKIITDVGNVTENAELETILYNGRIKSKIQTNNTPLN